MARNWCGGCCLAQEHNTGTVIAVVFRARSLFNTLGVSMSSIKTPLMALAIASAAALAPLSAQAEGLSFNLGVESSYGDDAKDFSPSLQGGVDYEFANGFYVGNGNATGRFESGDVFKSTVESSFYVGYAQEFDNGFNYDLTLSRDEYIGLSTNANELNLDVGYGPVTISFTQAIYSSGFDSDYAVGVTFAHEFTKELSASLLIEQGSKDSSSLYSEVEVSYDLGDDLSVYTVLNDANRPKMVVGLTKGF